MNSEDKKAADLFRYYAESATAQYDHVMSTSPERGWIFLLTKAFWNAAYKAKEEGKKIILSAGCAPIELIYSFDAIPVYMDMIATRTSDDQELTAKYVDIAEKLVPNSMCGITKIPYGVVMAGDMTIKPDAMMYSSVPCDSSRISYVAISR
ncbi:MAG: 2-hydroxyacyl-CoA dehydratase family protein, partial [Clostridiales Family XIII bacterium]|nr:2-hydroxyacyl-CoA dehydratase family protein [Clostridiales Family XIII bacterium]